MAVSIGKVYMETNYEKFKKLPDNRDVLSRRIGRLTASISSGWIMNPIIVNEKMEIIDGQGRFEALKSLKLPVYYTIAEGAGIEECRKLNKYNTTWQSLDFAKSYASSGVKSYILLLQACSKTGEAIGRILRITNHDHRCKGNDPSPFERGELKFNENDVNKAVAICQIVDDICEALIFEGRKNNAMYVATTIMVDWCGEKYDHKRMVNNCRSCRNSFAQMANVNDQLAEFERIYNFNTKSAKSRVFFTDYMRNRGRNARDYNKAYTPYRDVDAGTLKEVSA